LQIDFERSVFINCPFDEEYAPLFEAILFATVCCGFVPRSALDSGSVADPRMGRIIGPLFASKYSIHDLSRNRGDREHGLARFNMPFELGLAVARRHMTHNEEQHDWLLLVADDSHYPKYITDLAAHDPFFHDGTDASIVPLVMKWLAPHTSALPSPRAVQAALPHFRARKQELDIDWSGQVPWYLVIEAAEENAPKL